MKKISWNSHVVYLAIALGLAACLQWLSSEFREDGILGTLQESLQLAVVIPYIVGVIFGDNAHNPNRAGFFLGAFLQFYLLLILLRIVILRMKKLP